MQVYEKLYIDGKWVKPNSSTSIEVTNPTNEQVIGKIPAGNTSDVDLAISAAKKAFPIWSKSSIEERINILNLLSNEIKESTEELAQTITAEVGTPIGYSRMAMVGTPRVVTRSYAKILENFQWQEEVRNSIIVKEPIGVCAFITPWNFPLHQIIGKVAPALAAGCTMILKPSKEAPLNAFLLAEIMDKIGVPKGVFNLVSGHGSEIGEYLSEHSDIDMVSFTGSTRAGKLIQKNAADTIKKVTLELGGKGGNIVFADSYPDAVRDGVRNIMSNSGQSCDAPTRMLVQKPIYERAVKEAVDEANKIKVDLASKKGDHIGPLVSKVQYDKVINLINAGIKEGATLAAGGPELPNGLNKGYFVKPTIFTDVNNDMRIAREEIFGPVLSIIPFETEEEAIAIVNDTSYGLGNYLQTEDKEKAQRVARKVRAGTVYINGQGTDTGAPFGGYKQSGNGREGGVWGFNEFLEVKAITGWN